MNVIIKIYMLILILSSCQCATSASDKNLTNARETLHLHSFSSINSGPEIMKRDCNSSISNALPEISSIEVLYSSYLEEYAFNPKKEFPQTEVKKEDRTKETAKIFKMGFEFQSQPLCPWAKGIKELKTNPIFTVKKDGRTLWDLTIDWDCLEFITIPFSNSEKGLLEECMESIELSLDVLTNLNNANRVLTTFSEWINGEISATHYSSEDPELKTQEIRHIEGLRSLLIQRGLTLDVLNPQHFSKPIEIPYGWSPIFTPQVTIQHKLESNAALMMVLSYSKENLIKENEYYLLKKNPEEISYYESLFRKALCSFSTPIFTDSNENVKIPVRNDPLNSFLLFFNYSCISMSQFKYEECSGPSNYEIKNLIESCLEGTGQVNAKSSTPFMWRRPFSEVFKQVNTGQNQNSFRDIFYKLCSPDFVKLMPLYFEHMSYGEYHYNTNGRICDLTPLIEHINNILPGEIECLKRGVLMTTSIGKLDSSIKIYDINGIQLSKTIADTHSNSFFCTLDSISNPTTRYDFEPNNLCVCQSETSYDLLSPPRYLSPTDSMGAYKDSKLINSEYGELIVEFRGLLNIATYALSRMGLERGIYKDQFLTKPLFAGLFKRFTLADQACRLFDFIKMELTDSKELTGSMAQMQFNEFTHGIAT